MRLLIATRSISHSESAVRLGNLINQIAGGQMTLLTVVDNQQDLNRAKAGLLQAEKILKAAGSKVEQRIRTGLPVEEIAAESAENYDLLIIGEPERNRLIRRQRAPIAEDLIARSDCPVLIVRNRPRQINSILICQSGHEPSLVDVLTARMPSLLRQAEQVTILHVMSQIAAGPGVSGWALRADAVTLRKEKAPEGLLLEGELAKLEGAEARLEAKVRHGLVIDEILDEARGGNYDLVVIGSPSAAGWRRLLLGDLAREIIGRIERSLLVIKR